MIEVTKKNKKGTIEIVAQYETEEDFGKVYLPYDIPTIFDTKPNLVGTKDVWLPSLNAYIHVPCFMHVVYNGKGKVLDVGYLVGLARKYHPRWNKYHIRSYIPGTKSNWHTGCHLRHMKTTQERRWANAWDDEEFAPKYRARRSGHNLPNVWDDYWRFNQKNWKKFRNHQWKD